MATWREFEGEAPELAAEVRQRFEAHKTHVLATLRRDGSPRVSGSEVELIGADLMFGSMPDAMKARDLLRDGRCAIHAHPGEGDAKVMGVAVEIIGPEKEALGSPPGVHDFRLDLTDVVLTSVDQAAELLVIQHWRPGRGVEVTKRR
ncbi:pyridoxamine 5'-phosphate oxidase family protein [Nocardia sp. CDC159]|uniref:Pyridoxamine 5'-phosphate oxidase family protein n=1 Tax=Nocardia pulmonis TaxID=2951408 RepID=A0A9X2EAJ8_9NOCA|nr:MULTISPECIES: pyridoxamine 5'-phosphate oxidase family protein [Nocardia]MCM6774811.1 pyridoxamine 5'-phosphate oxidase family protein [Nocardia pulmonis]MCM6789742.1 pyridoxamine 5'-phosphate oxidase family protein [Nocardia sp. CDC159]